MDRSNVIPISDPVRERRLIAAADLPTLRGLAHEPGDSGSMARAELFLRGERGTDSPGLLTLADRMLDRTDMLETLLAGGPDAAALTFEYAEGRRQR